MKPMNLPGALAAVVARPAGAAPDIRDIRGPLTIPSIVPTLLAVAAAVAVALLLVAVTYALVRRLRRARVKTAAELALERLDRARSTVRDGRAAALCAELSDAVREYIEARFELRAAHRTTEEFLRELVDERESPVATHRESLGNFLGACDLAKFARFAIDVEHMGAMVEAAQAFVRATAGSPGPRATSGDTAGAVPAQEVRA